MDDSVVQEIIHEFEKPAAKLADPLNVDRRSRYYWKKIFRIMDTYSAVPMHKRKEVLLSTLHDPRLIDKLSQIYEIKPHDPIIDFDGIILEEQMKKQARKEKRPDARMAYAVYPWELPSDLDTSMNDFKRRLKSKLRGPRPPPLEIVPKPHKYVDFRKELHKTPMQFYENETMYSKFLKKSPEDASRWRPRPPVTWDGLPLADKCDAITGEIAKNFVEWMNGLSGEMKTKIDVKGITELFEIGFSCHAADSLKLKVQELNAVPECVANARHTPELSVSTQLYRQLFRDKTAVRNREANFAFGTMLPPEMRSGTSQDSDVSKWLENKRVPEKLATMAVVWEDIEKLKTTEGYCLWLQEHDEITPPAYLIDKGLLDNAALTITEPRLETSNASVQTQPKTSKSSSILPFEGS